jgi:hypothetical protein
MRTILLVFLLMLVIIPYSVMGNYTARATPSETIAPVETAGYNSLIDSFGGDESPEDEDAAEINWTGMVEAIASPYVDLMGVMFYLMAFSIPFISMWIAQEKTWIPLGAGILLVGFATMSGWIPAEYQMPIIIFVALSIAAVIWMLLRDRL